MWRSASPSRFADTELNNNRTPLQVRVSLEREPPVHLSPETCHEPSASRQQTAARPGPDPAAFRPCHGGGTAGADHDHAQCYGGDGAYLAIYLTDKAGKLQQTIHVAGGKAKYHKHLSAWYRQSGGRIDGTTGASVGSGRSLTVSAEIADALIDAGFEIRWTARSRRKAMFPPMPASRWTRPALASLLRAGAM